MRAAAFGCGAQQSIKKLFFDIMEQAAPLGAACS